MLYVSTLWKQYDYTYWSSFDRFVALHFKLSMAQVERNENIPKGCYEMCCNENSDD